MSYSQYITLDLNKSLFGGRVSILGVGNALNGDDGVGCYVAEKLKTAESENFQVIDASTVPENFIGLVDEFKPDVVLIIDAAGFEASPGEVREIEPGQIKNVSVSTHGMSLAILHRILSSDGIKVVFLGIQPKQAEVGEPLSREVKEAADGLCQQVLSLL